MATIDPASDALLFVAIGLIAAGFLWKRRETHLLRAFGWTVFGIYWWVQIPRFLGDSDAFNAFAAALALPAFMFLAYHEALSYKWKEEYLPLRFVAGAVFFAGVVYIVVDRVPLLSGGLIKLVADHTASIMNGLGGAYTAGGLDMVGNPPWYRSNFEELFVPITYAGQPVVRIVLACSALQAIVVSWGFVMATATPAKQKGLVLLVTIVPIYFLNLVRNVVVIFLYFDSNLDFEIAHGVVGKIISLVSLVFLVLLAFHLMPEMYESINGLMDLPWRKTPRHEYLSKGRSTAVKQREPSPVSLEDAADGDREPDAKNDGSG